MSRGDEEGEDITENLKTIDDIPNKSMVKFSKDIDIKIEVLFKIMTLKDKGKFTNPRNAASGSLRQKDQRHKNSIKFIAYIWI